MTAPTVPASPPTSVPEQIQQHDLAALALETAAAVAATATLRDQLQALTRGWLLAWQKTFGDLHARQSGPLFTGFMQRVRQDLNTIRYDPAPALLDYIGRSHRLGVRQAFAEADTKPVPLPTRPSPQLVLDATQAAAKAQQRITTAATLAGTVREGSFTAVTQTAAPAQQAANDIEQTARTVTNQALNDGITQVAEHLDMRRVWVAERDACRVCLALSGRVVSVGHEFPVDATFGEKPLTWVPIGAGGLTGPPRHPNCRCRCSPWSGNEHDPLSLPRALRREAERSIFLGLALPSESERARAQAADRLLQKVGMEKGSRSPSGWPVPQSVKERAERALRRGTFTTGPVPVPKPKK